MKRNLLTVKTISPFLLFVFVCFFSLMTLASDADFEARKNALIELELEDTESDNVVFQAFKGTPVNQEELDKILELVTTSAEADFRLTRLLRILYFQEGVYDDQILPVINSIPYWLPDEENLRQYWSENHMLMWMSADWLLHEKYGKPTRETLRQNLVHYLKLKIEYGYYEFNSPIYLPFTTAGLLNLVDFAEDQEIQDLATKAVTRLLNDAMLFLSSQGVYYPPGGRTTYSKYFTPKSTDMANVLYLITGLGEPVTSAGIGSTALATSTFDAIGLLNDWQQDLTMTFKNGHPLSKAREIHAALDRKDRVIFQWSSGAYFHPTVANDLLWGAGYYNMWEHEEFEAFAWASILPPSIGVVASTFAASLTRSSYIGQVEIEIFKNDAVVLNSAQDFWKGRLGYQQIPLVANIGGSAVMMRCGTVEDWNDLPSRQSNTSLPYIDQDENVALIMYRHNWDLPVFGINNFDVFLYFQEEEYDEVKEMDNWILGRKGENYVAVRRHCINDINGIRACDVEDGQTWAIVAGNDHLHNNFGQFQDVIAASQYESRWYFDWQNFKWVYFGRIKVDGQDIKYAWKGSILSQPNNTSLRDEQGDRLSLETEKIKVYPNPVTDQFSIDFSSYEKAPKELTVYNVEGKQVFYKANLDRTTPTTISTLEWAQGAYSVVINNGESLDVKRVVVKH
ncbi:MAG: T9SS type A sorting domain-containing protein [Chitinophagales bacterium]